MVTWRITISLLTTHGFGRIEPSATMPTSPGFKIGVPVSTPKTPMLVMVMVPFAMSAGVVRPSRAVAASCSIALANSRSDIWSASLMFGTIRPRGVAAATPKFTKLCTMISSSVQVELTVGLRRTAQIMALAIISSGVTLTPAKSVEALRRFTYSMVLVASTSTKMLTCGAVKADLTIALAIALRTPFTGIRSSRSVGAAGVERFLKTLACWAPPRTSSRVTSPAIPVATTLLRSTPRSFASLRIGGFAITCSLDATTLINPVAGAPGITGIALVCGATTATGSAMRLRRRDCPP